MLAKPAMMLCLAAVAVSVTAQTNSWELSQPGAKLLMGIDIKSLRESTVGQSIREQMKMQPSAAGTQSPLQGPMQAMAQGLLEQIDRVFLSSQPNPSATGAASAKSNPTFLVVVEGRFPLAELQPFLKGAPRRYRDADVYHTTQTDTTSVALLKGEADSSTLVLGDEKSVLAAIARRGTLVPPSALVRRAQALATTHDFWMIADGPLSGFKPSSAAASNPLASKIAAQVKGLDMGLALRDGLQFELGVAAETDEAAAQMTQLLSSQIQMAMVGQANRPETAEIVRKLNITAEGNRMRLSLTLTKDEFEQQMRAAQEARAKAVALSASQTPRQPAPRPVKPATPPGQITIYGLEGSPRVIQSTH
ncbi:MAG: hypothetical protein ABI833_14825 [Acidobacteriota bacterium]